MQALLRRTLQGGSRLAPRVAAAAGASLLGAAALAGSAVADAPASALSPSEFRSFKVVKIEHVSPNTKLYRFALPDPKQNVGLPVASCLVTRANIGEGGKPVIRPYTPVSHPDEKGHFDLVVKAYPTGVMSKHFDGLKVGDSLECKGPMIKLPYEANKWQAIGMVAGGTGIAPMLQVIEEVLRNPADKTQLSLVFGNVTQEDILLKGRLDALAAKHPGRFKILYCLDSPPKGWKGGAGYVTPAMLKEALPPPGEKHLVLVCGPPGMMAAISGGKAKDYSQGELSGALKQLGYMEKGVFKF